jgi:hypothetical protein
MADNPYSSLFEDLTISGEEFKYFNLTALNDERYGKYKNTVTFGLSNCSRLEKSHSHTV